MKRLKQVMHTTTPANTIRRPTQIPTTVLASSAVRLDPSRRSESRRLSLRVECILTSLDSCITVLPPKAILALCMPVLPAREPCIAADEPRDYRQSHNQRGGTKGAHFSGISRECTSYPDDERRNSSGL